MKDSSQSVPYWRLSALYATYFSVFGMVMPYFGPFLNTLGLSGQEIGTVMAGFFTIRIFGPNFWAWLSDRSGKRLLWVQIGAFFGFLLFLGMFWARGFYSVLTVVMLFGFFWNAILAQIETLTLEHLTEKPLLYGKVRVWGSIGFVVAVAGLGVWFERASAQTLPYWIAISLFAIFMSACSLPARDSVPSSKTAASFKAEVFTPAVIGFFLAQSLLQVSHGPYYTFFSLYLEDFGYSSTWVGIFWALGVVVEVLFFMVVHRVLGRISANTLMLIALALTVLRWCLIAFGAQWLGILLIGQVLHAASFAATHAAAIEWIRQKFSVNLQGQGQALYSAVAWGGGAALGSIISGQLWESDHASVFVMAAVAALLAFVITWLVGLTQDSTDNQVKG